MNDSSPALSSRRHRVAAALIAFTLVSLLIAGAIHLGIAVADSGDVSGALAAGTAELVIAVVLGLGLAALADGRVAGARAATAVASLGFVYGLTKTIGGADSANLVYHAVMLPVLLTCLALLHGPGAKTGRPAIQ